MKKLKWSSWAGRTLDEDKLCRALLQYHNTPSCEDGTSPVQKLYGHPVQDSLPAHRHSFSSDWQCKTAEVEKQLGDTLETSTQFSNAYAYPLPDIPIGSKWPFRTRETKLLDIYDTVTEICPHRRYYIKTHGERVLIRNCRFLHHRIPLPYTPNITINPPVDTIQAATTTAPLQEPPPRHTLCTLNPPQRLIHENSIHYTPFANHWGRGGGRRCRNWTILYIMHTQSIIIKHAL